MGAAEIMTQRLQAVGLQIVEPVQRTYVSRNQLEGGACSWHGRVRGPHGVHDILGWGTLSAATRLPLRCLEIAWDGQSPDPSYQVTTGSISAPERPPAWLTAWPTDPCPPGGTPA